MPAAPTVAGSEAQQAFRQLQGSYALKHAHRQKRAAVLQRHIGRIKGFASSGHIGFSIGSRADVVKALQEQEQRMAQRCWGSAACHSTSLKASSKQDDTHYEVRQITGGHCSRTAQPSGLVQGAQVGETCGNATMGLTAQANGLMQATQIRETCSHAAIGKPAAPWRAMSQPRQMM